jgi:hypothetical protein
MPPGFRPPGRNLSGKKSGIFSENYPVFFGLETRADAP